MKKTIGKILFCLFSIYMLCQIILGIIWMAQNIHTIPQFGDTAEYISLSQSLVVDEYRAILYPILLRIAIHLQNVWGIEYQIFMYFGQTILCFLCIFYACNYIRKELFDDGFEHKRGLLVDLFISLYLMTVPMITFHNFTILTDSIALSALIVVVIQLIRISKEKIKVSNYIIFFISYMIEIMIRADRVYSVGIFVIAFCIVQLIRKQNFKKNVILVGVYLITVLLNFGINYKTQQKGAYGRIETNLEFVLLDRVVWPHMVENYEFFDDDVKSVVTIDDAVNFDNHNNNVMYIFAPNIESRVGKEQAEKIYMSMVKTVFRHMPLRIAGDITRDFGIYYFSPFISQAAVNRTHIKTNMGWIKYNYELSAPKLTDTYLKYYNIGYGLICLPILIILCLFTIKNDYMKKLITIMLPHFLMLLIICLWFSLGDGAEPVLRYVLYGYLIWTMLGVYVAALTMHKKLV